MLKLGTLRWKGRCGRHPRYDPAVDGEGGIRGGCRRCMDLLEIHQQHKQLINLLRSFGPMRERAGKTELAGDRRQRGLFD